jgi:5-methylcytosine-specific restriction protein A
MACLFMATSKMRDVPEWIGDDNAAVPPRVKIRIFEKYEGKCACCDIQIVGKIRPAYDHRVALANGGANAESNVQLLCVPCHSKKTRTDVAVKSKIARVKAKHIGLKKPRTIRSWRKFNGEIVNAGRNR